MKRVSKLVVNMVGGPGRIFESTKSILNELPQGVSLLIATKGQGIESIEEALHAGAKICGENYLQEAIPKIEALSKKFPDVHWHYIGKLQKSKIKRIVKYFDAIETLDSFENALLVSKAAQRLNKLVPVLIEINSGNEPQKSGVLFDEVIPLAEKLADMKGIELKGVMTMGPKVERPEEIRPYFKKTREVFEEMQRAFGKERIEWLSMGTSDTYKIAIEEGSNIVRIGTLIFGSRKY